MNLLAAPFGRRFRTRSAEGGRKPVASRRRLRAFGEAERLERRDLMAVDIVKLTPDTFFINNDNRTITSEYEAIKITNNSGTNFADVWAKADTFTGGVVSLGTNEDGYYQIGALAAGASDIAYFYLRADAGTSVDQTHKIRLYEGDPRTGGVPIEDPVGTPVTAESTFFDVYQTLETSSNKIFSVAYDSADPVLGSTLTMTVTGDLGQANNDSVLFSPASFDDWLPDVYVLKTMTIDITGTNARTLIDDLYDTGFASSSSNPYTAVYTFRLAGVSAGTTASPTQFVGRGGNWKHHDPGNVVLPPVSPVANSTTVQKLVKVAGSLDAPAASITIPDTGATVEFSLRFTNTSSRTVKLDSILDTLPSLPANATYIAGTSTYDNNGTPVSIGNPAVTGQDLKWLGPFSILPNSTAVLKFQASIPALVGTYVNAATGRIGTTVIDTTLDTNDNVPATATVICAKYADLNVLKTRLSGAPVAGETVTYQIKITNQGPSTVVGFTLTDSTAPLLIGATFGAPSAGSYNSGTGAWTGLSLATGQFVTITLTGTVPAAASGDLVNTATVAPQPGVIDPDDTDNTSTVTDVLLLVSDLNVVKVRTSGQPVAGELVSYQITVTNQGPSTITSFTGIDTTMPMLESPSYTVSSGTYDPGTGIWTGPALATGGTVVFTLTGAVPAAATGLLVNTATVAPPPGYTDPDPSDDSSTVTDEIDLVSDLNVLKTRTSGSPVAGETVTYQIKITNQGPSTVVGFTLTDSTAPVLIGATFGTPSAGTYNSGTGAWTGLSLATGQFVTITLTGTVPAAASGDLVNTATVAPQPGVIDPDQTDNTSTVTDVLLLVSDLNVVKVRTSGQPVAGELVSYQITVTNQGPSTITSFTGVDTTMPMLESPSYTVSSGTYDPGTGIWTGPALATGGTVVFTLTGTVPAAATGLLVNTATVAPPPGYTDPDPSDDSSTVTDGISGVVDLTVTKTGDITYKGGGLLNFMVVVTNKGPSFAAGVNVVDALPTGVVNWSWNVTYTGAGSGTADGSPDSVTNSASGIGKLMNLAVLGTATFTITALTDSAFKKDIVNTATATIGQESATATFASVYDGPINPTADVAALVIGTDDSCGIAPWVRIVDPVTGTILSQFLAYEPGFRGGVRVTSGDVTGDGIAEIIVAPGRNRIGQIRVFTPQGVELTAYRTFPFGTAYRGGVEVAVGDVDGDGVNDIIAGMSTGNPMVRVFKVTPTNADPVANTAFRSFRAFPAPYANGTMVAAGDFGTYFNGVKTSSAPDGIAEIVTGTNAGTRAWTRIWDVSVTPKVVRGAFVIAPGFRGGVTLSTARWDGDAIDDVIVGAGIGGNSIVEVYSGATGGQLARLTAFSSFVKTNARAFAAALDLTGDGIVDNLYGVKGLNGGGGARGVRQYARSTGIVSQLTSSPLLAPPLRIAPITLRVPAR
jgi:uncharacterized repeat protein (TIGR01451 family)